MVIASPWRRLMASLIDGLILVPLSFLLMALAGINPLAQTTTFVQDLLFNWIPSWAYYVIFTALYGATPGKMALGLKVVRTDGQPVDWLTAFMREVVGKTLSTLPLLLGYLWAFFHPRRQAWHDLIADTLVVRPGQAHALPVKSSTH
ncbi:RDD family protein [Thermus tengchongensis]|uniref:RDD family protein n=1 Tax=Thermus tengchongensis TaxID=1214928 RepID=A0A4Y9F8C7_9DEIN|nr:RDD family protein [Thermus tengchongensis]TFU16846.1 RDD family protein [Thermus tengchongensis]TFU25424.1 RDD family protein [Thermus tengchongensis]